MAASRGGPDSGTPGVETAAALLKAAAGRIGRLDARLLLQHLLEATATQLYAHPEREVSPGTAAEYRALVARRHAGEPLAHLTGTREFYGLALRVTPDVLIPRPETELLVDLALERLPPGAPARVLELGTGSGAIAIALACERPAAKIVAGEHSAAALRVARGNAKRLAGSALSRGRLVLRQGDWFEAAAGERFDLIVSNPPYVAAGDPHLAAPELRHEPASALVAGSDGLDCLRLLAVGAAAHLNPGGWLLVEHGFDQGAACRELFGAGGLSQVQTWQDLAGLDRVTGGRLTEASAPR